MTEQQQSSEAVLCHWCRRPTHPWPDYGEHKHKWRWCHRCEAGRNQDGTPFEEDDD